MAAAERKSVGQARLVPLRCGGGATVDVVVQPHEKVFVVGGVETGGVIVGVEVLLTDEYDVARPAGDVAKSGLADAVNHARENGAPIGRVKIRGVRSGQAPRAAVDLIDQVGTG